jgi:superfamily II DNA or RNA helicase
MVSLRGKGAKDGIEFEAPRRSGRANKATGSMFEQIDVDEDNFYVEDDRTPSAPKVMAVKEIFQPLPSAEAGFRDVHSPDCATCDTHNTNKGALVFCQGCSYSYHKNCLGQRAARDHLVTKIGHESFVLQCRYCVNLPQKKDKRAPDVTRCFACREPGKSCKPFSQRKTAKQEEQLRLDNDGEDPIQTVDRKLINNAETCLFRCSTCRRAFHFEHLPNASGADARRITSDTDSLRAKNIEEYSIEWKCKDCGDAPAKIDALVAWRPVDRENYIGQRYLDYGEDHIEYLIKWDKQSHRHCVWMPGSWVWGATHGAMRSAFAKRVAAEEIGPHFDVKDAIPAELTTIDVILSVQYKPGFRAISKVADFPNVKRIDKVYVKFLGLGYDKTVWDDPPPSDSGQIYDEFLSAYDEYLAGVYFEDVSRSEMSDRIKKFRALDFAEEVETSEQPRTIRNGELMKYQISGVNWLKYNYHKQHNAILADEMGLGKTVQIVALLADLIKDAPRVWPFLVVVPNSTVPNWRREIKKWAPDLRVVTYHGGKQAQDLAFRFELFPRGSATIKAHIVVMSYEAAQDPATKTRFNSVHFAGLIVDEGHRLKNDENMLYAALTAMKIPYRVLLTGTPLQNNKRELFNLLQFLNPKLDAATLDEEYGELTADNIPKLHDTIRPYFLRRTKADTLKFLPKMARVIIPVTMTVLQEKLSKSIIAKNSVLIHAILAKGKLKATERGSLNNILMQLRKCLCHPFMYSSAVEDRVDDPAKMHSNLVDASAKLLLLNIMLPKLKEQGHRVLLFSQFLDQLNIMEDFLSGIGLTFSRIDGNMSSLEKQKRIDAYNAPDSPIFVMLLSTRAGGVGINLATADTVIILDPDFNPHQDLQAVSRCHRIGQRKPVLCFQLTTKDSVEEKILQAGRKKMALDHALIETMDEQKEEVHDLESILKHGAEALFGEAKRETIVYDSAAVDKLLDRDRLIAEQNPPEGEQAQTLNDAFAFARVWDNGAGDVVTEAPNTEVDPVINQSVWEEILRKREEEARREAEANKETLGRGARRRGKVRLYHNAPQGSPWTMC